MAEPVVKKARTDNRPGRKDRTDNPTNPANPYGDPWPLAVLNFKSDAQEIEEEDMKQEEKAQKELQFKEYHEEVAARHKSMQESQMKNYMYWNDQEMAKEKEKDQGEKDQEKDKEFTRLLRSRPPQEHHSFSSSSRQQQQERADRRDRERENRIADRRVAGLIRDYFPEWNEIEVHTVYVQGRSLWQVLRDDIAVPDHRSGRLMQTTPAGHDLTRQGLEYFQRLREIYRRRPRGEPDQYQDQEAMI
jgi:hypothetical protein